MDGDDYYSTRELGASWLVPLEDTKPEKLARFKAALEFVHPEASPLTIKCMLLNVVYVQASATWGMFVFVIGWAAVITGIWFTIAGILIGIIAGLMFLIGVFRLWQSYRAYPHNVPNPLRQQRFRLPPPSSPSI